MVKTFKVYRKLQTASLSIIIFTAVLMPSWGEPIRDKISAAPAAPAPAPKVVYETGFETDIGGFAPRGGVEVLTRTDEIAHSGSWSLKVENRSRSWHGPTLNIGAFIKEGGEYTISLGVKLIGPESAQLRLSTQIGGGSSASYLTIDSKKISKSDAWVQLTGTYRYAAVSSVTIYIESDDALASFYIDDIRIEEISVMALKIEDITPLKSVYKDYFLVGNILSGLNLEGARFDFFAKHFNIATAENAMKPSSLQHDKGVFTFESADAMVDKALGAGMKMHGHTLAWHQQSPDWMNYEGIPRDEAVENLITHAKTVAEHFKGRVISWDVLNEAIIDNPPAPTDWKASLRQSAWYKAIGPDYIEIVFRAAREADPGAKLYYNDYNLDNQNKALAVYTMVKELNEQFPDVGGRPLIDGIGMQGHYRVNTNPDNVTASMERFISLGVEISITELDVQAGADSTLSERQAAEQGISYAALFKVFKAHAKNLGRVTIWGLDDGTSWRSATNPTLFDKDLKAKSAYYAALDPDTFIKENKTILTVDSKQGEAYYAAPRVDGTIDPLWDRAPEIPVNQYLMAWQGASGSARVLWDEANLYVLIRVQNAELNKSSPRAHEQDSIEVFIDENNSKTKYFEKGDGQYRVNFAGETSFNPLSAAEGFESAVSVSGKSYTAVMKIPFKTITPSENTLIGFDIQINGASVQGVRQSIAVWNDTSGESYRDTSGYGVLKLIKNKPLPKP
jgi:endo-1,4-beta-xylanase